MRAGIAVVGLVLLLIGLALWYVPFAGPSSNAAVPNGSALTVQGSAPAALLTSSFTWTVSWTATSSSVTVTVYDCGTSPGSCTNSGLTVVKNGTGSSGSLSWSGPKAEAYAILVTGGSGATVTYGYAVPIAGGLAGIALTFIGFILLIAGAAMRKKSAPMPPMPAASQ